MEICRLCLFTDLNHNNMFKIENNNVDTITKIRECVSIDVFDSTLNVNVCKNCMKKVDNWVIFKEMCLKNNEVFKNFKRKKNFEDEITIEKDELPEEETRFKWSNADFDVEMEESNVGEQLYDLKHENRNHRHTCEICSDQFDSFFDYLDHQLRHNGSPVFKCSKCEEVFSTRQDLVQHDKDHKVSCPECGLNVTQQSLKIHLVKHTDKFVCSRCERSFASQNNLKEHFNYVHSKKKNYVCETCGKQFPSSTCLKTHALTHSKQRKYKCTLCDYAGRTSSSLRIHKSKHVNEVHICEYCSKIFKSGRNLRDHLRRVHVKEKKVQCEYCDIKLTEKYMLKAHMRTHTGVRPYQCELCDKAFSRSDSLKEHLLTHGPRVQYQCEKCLKTFNNRRGRFRHQCIKENPFKKKNKYFNNYFLTFQ